MSVPIGAGHGLVSYSARQSQMWFKATADTDDGDVSIMERVLPVSGRRPPPHRHTNCTEAYFVLDGLVSVQLEDDDYLLEPQQFLLVQRGARHTFGNGADREARLLVIHAPAMDRYFAELHDLWHRDEPPTAAEERELMSRHGMETG